MSHSFSTSTQAPLVLQRVESLGFVVFKDNNHDINLIAARNLNGRPNKFDDVLHVIFKEDHLFHHYEFVCTTDPGLYHLHSPSRVAGTAIVKHDQQVRSGFTFGQHKGQYDCLVPTKPIPVWRDHNKDNNLDHQGNYTSSAIQIHRASAWRRSSLVNKWSAGCIVIADPESFSVFMNLMRLQVKAGLGDMFSLTVIGWPALELSS